MGWFSQGQNSQGTLCPRDATFLVGDTSVRDRLTLHPLTTPSLTTTLFLAGLNEWTASRPYLSYPDNISPHLRTYPPVHGLDSPEVQKK